MANDEEVWRKLVSSIDRTQLPSHVDLLDKICTSVQASITRPPRSKEEMRAAFHTIKRAKAFWEGKLSKEEKEKLFHSNSSKVHTKPQPRPPPPVAEPKLQVAKLPPPPSPSPPIHQQNQGKARAPNVSGMRKQRMEVHKRPPVAAYEATLPEEEALEDESPQAPPMEADYPSEEKLPPLSSYTTYFPDEDRQGEAGMEGEHHGQLLDEGRLEEGDEQVPLQEEDLPPPTSYEAYYPEHGEEGEAFWEGEQYGQPSYQPEWEKRGEDDQAQQYACEHNDVPEEQLPPLSSYATYIPGEEVKGEHSWVGDQHYHAEYHEEQDEQLDLDQPLPHPADGRQYEPAEESGWDEEVEYERPLCHSGAHLPDEHLPPLSAYATYLPGVEGGEGGEDWEAEQDGHAVDQTGWNDRMEAEPEPEQWYPLDDAYLRNGAVDNEFGYEEGQDLPLDAAEAEHPPQMEVRYDPPVEEYTHRLSQQDEVDDYQDGYRHEGEDIYAYPPEDERYVDYQQGEYATYDYPADCNQDEIQDLEPCVYGSPQHYYLEPRYEEEREEAWREEAPQPKYVGAGLECHLAAEQEERETFNDAGPTAAEQSRKRTSLPSRPLRSTPPRSLNDLLADQPITPTPTTAGKKRKALDDRSPSPPIRWIDDPLLQNPKWFNNLAASHPDPDQPTARMLANFALARDRTLLRALQAADFDLVERESAIQGADLLLSPGVAVLFRDLASLGKDLGKLMEDIDLASRHSTRVIVVFAPVSYGAWERKDDGSPLEVDQLTDNVARGLSNLRSRLKYIIPGVNGVLGYVELVFAKHGAAEIAKVIRALHDEEQQRAIKDMPENEAQDWIDRRWLSEDSAKDEELLMTRHRINSFTAQYVLRIFGSASGIYSRPLEQVRSFLEPVLGKAITDRLLAPLPNPQLVAV